MPSFHAKAAFTLLALGLAACSADAAVFSEPVVTTLPGGARHVHNPSTGLWDREPERRWRLVEEARIGQADGGGPETFGRVGGIIEDPLGRLWVEDYSANEIRVFERNGAFVRTVGRKGSGPGEFSRLGEILLGPDGNIWVDDAGGRRWEVFDTAGARVAGHPLVSNVGASIRSWTPDRRLIEVRIFPEEGVSLLDIPSRFLTRRLQPDGSLVPSDTFDAPSLPEAPELVTFTRPDGRPAIILPLPLTHRPMSVLASDGDFWLTDGGGPYVIRRQNLAGDTLLVIERDYSPVPVSEETFRIVSDSLKPRLGLTSNDNDPARLPRVHPPFRQYHPARDSTLWVIRTADGETTVLDVFDASGVYLGAVHTSVDLNTLMIRDIGPDRMYAVATDDLGVQSVVVLRIEKP